MIARAVHPIPAPPEEECLTSDLRPLISSGEGTRLRRVTNDPASEYAARLGAVAPLPNSVAALILCKKGWAKIERHQIKVTLDGEDFVFTSRDSVVIAAKNGTGERVLWALNRRAPDLLHLLTNDGRYVESVPRKGEAQWFSQDAASGNAYAEAQAMIQRDARRLRDLHASDTTTAAETAQQNAAEVHRIVQTFPSAAPERQQSAAPEQSGVRVNFAKADEITSAMEAGETQRTHHVARVVTTARRIDAETRDLSDLLPHPEEPGTSEPAEERIYDLSDLA